MFEWDAIIQGLVSAAAVTAAIHYMLKKLTEKSIDHFLDKKLKNYELSLDKKLENHKSKLRQEGFLEQKRAIGYDDIANCISKTHRRAKDLFEDGKLHLQGIEDLKDKNRNFEKSVHENRLKLRNDGLYKKMHEHKNQMISFAQNTSSVIKWRDRKNETRANEVWSEVEATWQDLSIAGDQLVDELTNVIFDH